MSSLKEKAAYYNVIYIKKMYQPSVKKSTFSIIQDICPLEVAAGRLVLHSMKCAESVSSKKI